MLTKTEAWFEAQKARIVKTQAGRAAAIRKAEQSFIKAARRYLDASPMFKQGALDAMVDAEDVLDRVIADKQPRGKYKLLRRAA